jgi:hypothetical protein
VFPRSREVAIFTPTSASRYPDSSLHDFNDFNRNNFLSGTSTATMAASIDT